MSMNEAELKALSVCLAALADALKDRSRQASRYIEPIGRQAATIAAKVVARRGGASLDDCPVP
jgi:hypothetical protein